MLRKLLIISLLPAIIAGCKKEEPQFTDIQLELMPQPQTTGLPEPTGGFTLSVGSDTLKASEIVNILSEYFKEPAQNSNYEAFYEIAQPQVQQLVMVRISNILLYEQAKKQTDENMEDRLKEAVESEVRRFIAELGGDYAKAEQVLKAEGFTGWEDFKDYQKRLILTQSYMASKMPEEKPVTYSEMMDYYNKIKGQFYTQEASVTFELIDIQPDKLYVAEPNKTKQQFASEQAEQIIKRLQKGEDFAELAKQFSHGPWAQFGGKWKPINPDSLAEPYDILSEQAKKLEEGQIAGPIEAEGHIFILKLVDKQLETEIPFEKVQNEIRQIILFERERKTIDDLGYKLMNQTNIGQQEEFVDFCVRKIYETAKTME